MKDTGKGADRMGPRISSPASMFEKVLRAFTEGDLHYADVQLDLKRLLTSGAPPEKLLEVLERWELLDPLPEYAHEGVLRLINEAIELAAVQNPDVDPAPGQIEDSGPARPGAGNAEPGPLHVDPRHAAPGHADPARAIALAEELTAAQAELELERSENRELQRALAERMESDEAERESDRYRVELSALRDSLAARDRTIAQVRHSLSERDSQLAALQREHAKLAPTLESRAKSGAQQEGDLEAARTRIAALTADLAAAHAAVQREQSKAQEIDRILAEKIALNDAAVSQREEAQRETERYRAELRTVRDSLAARDKTIAQVRHSSVERDAQFTALQQEQAKIVAALETRAKATEAELQKTQTRLKAVASELKASQDAAAALNTQRERGASHLIATRTELGAVQAQSNSYLEVLQTHEYRRGFDQNRFREIDAQADVAAAGSAGSIGSVGSAEALVEKPRNVARGDAQRAAESPTAPVAKIESLVARQSASRAPPQSERAARIAKPAPAKPGESWKPPRGISPAAGVGVAILVLVFAVWFFVHRAPAPATVPAASSAVVPKPGTVFRDCPTCPGLTVLPAGRFKQGSAGTDSGSSSFDKPLHWVVIGRPFAMSASAVTLDEFREFITAAGRDMQGCDVYDGEWKHRPESSWENPGFVQAGPHPVTCTSWDDAKAYAAWLSAKTGHRYRLPSASEWEYAARAGSEADHPWNPDGSGACASANVADQSAARRFPGWTVFGCDDGYIYTAPVGSFKASAFGLNDMLGNVFQWTEDCWHEDYKGAPVDGSARTDGDCSEHELRGGSWFTTPAFVRPGYRNHFAANYRTSSVGIRLVRDLAP
jgi:formylglycine-generating enzyme required for sulfatase activity